MKQELSFICPENVKNQVGLYSILEDVHLINASLFIESAIENSQQYCNLYGNR